MQIALWFVTLLALTPAFAGGGDEGWRPEKDEDGIQMFSRATEGWSIREIRGVTKIAARLSSIAAILADVSTATELNDIVVESRVLDRQDDTHYRTYAAMDMPWPVGDRDLVNQRTITQDPATLAVTIKDVALDGEKPREGFVRMVKSRQTWTLKPGADGTIDVELRVLADPNGPIPAAVINALSIDSPFATLGRLQEMAQRPKYADAKLSFVKEPAAPVKQTGEAP